MINLHRSLRNDQAGIFVAACDVRTSARKTSSLSTSRGADRLPLKVLTAALLMALGANAYAELPVGGVVTRGGATINTAPGSMTINQSTQRVAINWQSFNIGVGQAVQFVQPNSNSVALNRVLGSDPSNILGSLSANGKVFLINPNGILFGQGAQVNVGGLVASTRNITDSDFMAGKHKFAGTGSGAVVNQGSINANGGYVALLGAKVSNQGTIVANLGTVALAAGNAMTLDVAGDGLLNVTVNTGAVDALVENGGLLRANGGKVLMTAQAAGNLLQTVVNNTGVIQAQTLQNRKGRILLLGDMQSGTMNVGGTLDASAPNGGNGGFIETSAATVNIAHDVNISTNAPFGRTGTWLIDPQDFIIGAGGNISGATLSAQLVNTSVVIQTQDGTGNGDIFVNDAVSWSAAGAPTTLTLNAFRDVNINQAITATNGNLIVCCGRDVNVNAAITTTRGSVLLAGGRDVNQNAAITVTDGNLMMCAANDVNVRAAITLTRGTNDPTRSLGLPIGLTLSADTDGTGPGITGGTVVFAPGVPPTTVTVAPARIYYNPVSYTTPTDYLPRFVLTEGATLTQYMLVFAAGGDKIDDGTTNIVLAGLKGNPAGVTLVAGPGATARFDTPGVGTNKGISFTGYTLGGPNAGAYALPANCCGLVQNHTTGSISPAPAPPPPPTPPPPGTPPPVTPPPVTPPPPGTLRPPVPPPIGPIWPPVTVVVPTPTPEELETLVPETPPPVTPPPLPVVVPERPRKPDRN